MFAGLKAKRAAEKDARNTIGAEKVNNYLKVRPPNVPSDVDLADNIRKALDGDYLLNRQDFSVFVLNQMVSLSGTVDTLYEKVHAEDVASSVPGVIYVRNNVKVAKIWQWKKDNDIKSDIESQLFWSVFVDSDDISVTVRNGEATLSGMVDSWFELDMAVKNAFEGGAKSVKADLKIEDGPEVKQSYHEDYFHVPAPDYDFP